MENIESQNINHKIKQENEKDNQIKIPNIQSVQPLYFKYKLSKNNNLNESKNIFNQSSRRPQTIVKDKSKSNSKTFTIREPPKISMDIYKQSSSKKIGNMNNSFIQKILQGKNPPRYQLRNRAGSIKNLEGQFTQYQKFPEKNQKMNQSIEKTQSLKIQSATEYDQQSNQILKNQNLKMIKSSSDQMEYQLNGNSESEIIFKTVPIDTLDNQSQQVSQYKNEIENFDQIENKIEENNYQSSKEIPDNYLEKNEEQSADMVLIDQNDTEISFNNQLLLQPQIQIEQQKIEKIKKKKSKFLLQNLKKIEQQQENFSQSVDSMNHDTDSMITDIQACQGYIKNEQKKLQYNQLSDSQIVANQIIILNRESFINELTQNFDQFEETYKKGLDLKDQNQQFNFSEKSFETFNQTIIQQQKDDKIQELDQVDIDKNEQVSFNNDHEIFYKQNSDQIFDDLGKTGKSHQTAHVLTKNGKIFSNETIEVSVDSQKQYFYDHKNQSDAKNIFNILNVKKSKFQNDQRNLNQPVIGIMSPVQKSSRISEIADEEIHYENGNNLSLKKNPVNNSIKKQKIQSHQDIKII